MANFQPIVFRLDKELYGLDIKDVSAIENCQDIVRVPNASPNIKGIINLRGEIIPVVNMRVKFGCANQKTPETVSFIIVRSKDKKIALEVDGVEEIHNIEENDITELPGVTKGQDVDYLTKVAKSGNKLIIIVDPSRLLSEDEEAIAEQLRDVSE